VSVSGNTFNNSYENISGVQFITAPAVQISDPATTKGLINVNADNNIINSAMGNGIAFNNYTKVMANGNTISNTPIDGINISNTSGYFYGNQISNVGTVAVPASGLLVNGNSSGLIVTTNTVTDTRAGTSRTTDFAVKVCSANTGKVAPQIVGNKAKNLLKGIISQYYYQLNYILDLNNISI